MTRARVLLVVVGALVSAYGAWLLLQRSDVVEVAAWFVGGVVLHDAVLVPVALAVGVLLARLVPRALRTPLAAGLIVLAPVTLLAVPVLGRFGARPDNPTLLDRDYTAGWLVLAALVAVGVSLGVAVGALRARRSRARVSR